MAEDWTDSGTDYINDVADLDIPYKPHEIKTLSVEINFHSMLVLVDFKPIKEYILNGDVFPFKRENIQSRGHLNLERCRVVNVKSNCFGNACRFYTAHKFHNYVGKLNVCMEIDRDECNTGYCHQGRCESTDFEQDVCNCKYTRTLWVNKKNMMGEYCSIKRKEEVEQIVRWSQGYEIEVNFREEKIEVDLVPNFKDWSWRYYFIRFYEIKYNSKKISQRLVHAAASPEKGLKVGTGYSFVLTDALPNTTYLISTFGRKDLNPRNERERSFVHAVEVHTPGYAYLPAPTDLRIEPLPGNLFRLSWIYEYEILPSDFLINITGPSGKVEQEVSNENHEVLALQSSTSYTITVMSLNSIGDYKFASVPLQYTTPFFEYDKRVVGRYDFSRWFFKVNTITLDGENVYFKNPVRRDSRVKRLVLMCNYSMESIEPNGDFTDLFAAVYHAARFNQSYENHPPFSPYVTASLTTHPFPRRLLIGDRHVYNDFTNGPLDKQFFYQIYALVWYTAGPKEDVSIQFLGEIRLSKIPWVIIFFSVAVGALTLTVLTALVNCCFYKLVLARRQKQVEMLRGNVSVKSLLVEEIYMNDILADPDYDMTRSALEDDDSEHDQSQSQHELGTSISSLTVRKESQPKRRHTFTSVN